MHVCIHTLPLHCKTLYAGHNAQGLFDAAIRSFSAQTKRKLRYYGQYCDPSMQQIQLYGVYAPTERDIDSQFYQELACKHLGAGADVHETMDAAHVAMEQETVQLLEGDIHAAVKELLGMRVFCGGLSHAEYLPHVGGGVRS
jgi:hypothetical protein